MADYKKYENGVTICTKAADFHTQKGCDGFIENKRLNKCVFEKWRWICDCTPQTHQNVILYNKGRAKK